MKYSTLQVKLILPVVLSLVWGALLLSRATGNEDALITFRVIDNFWNGYGLRWNIIERVQAYTHPLWLLLNLPFYGVWPNGFQLGGLVGVAVSIAGAVILLRLCPNIIAMLCVFLCLYLSRSITEFSTSGLENGLSHLTLAYAVWVIARKEHLRYASFHFSLATALALMTRLDLAFICVPVLGVLLATKKLPFSIRQLVLGGVPLLVWSVFATIYYGSPIPNTVFAKLNGELADGNVSWGIAYLYTYMRNDPMGAFLLSAALVLWLCEILNLALRERVRWEVLAVSTGIVIHTLYVVRIGGDYMIGRFLTPGSFAAVGCIVLRLRQPINKNDMLRALAGLFCVFGLYANAANAKLPCWQNRYHCAVYHEYRILDVWLLVHNQHSILLPNGRLRERPAFTWTRWGLAKRANPYPPVQAIGIVGQVGYYAGPKVTLVDWLGLTDMFIAHMPIQRLPYAGHGERQIPDGYLETFYGDFSKIDPTLGEYVRFVQSITQGPIWSRERFYNILLLNTGWLDRELADYFMGARIDRVIPPEAPQIQLRPVPIP